MMPSLVGANMLGMPHQQTASGTSTIDAFFNQLSRQLIGNTRRYSRGANGQQRIGNGMRISKPSSASNSPRSSSMQARRRTLIGDGYRGGLQTISPAMEQMPLPTPAAETPSEPFYERQTTRSARPVSWHPSSQDTQQPFCSLPDAAAYPYTGYSEADILASLQQFPPTPAIYSGYASPAESFSPLSLPYSTFSSSQQPVYSPVSQPLQMPHQQQASPFSPVACSSSDYPAVAALSDIPYIPLPQSATDMPAWEHAQPAVTATFSQQTAPPTPQDFDCSFGPSLHMDAAGQEEQQQQQQQQQPTKSDVAADQACQPVIYEEGENDEAEGEILYGMGLYDSPDHGKEPTLHQSVVLSLLGSGRDQKEDADTGKGLGLKLEDAWEPPASDDEDEGEGDNDNAENDENQNEED
ncbi:hypothetical protein VTH82DRAFT_5024 [Thermothelomyces myriococcoides]